VRTPNGEPLRYFNQHVHTVTDDCTLWPYGEDGCGYGLISRIGKVHAMACAERHGPRPEGMEARHSCRNRRCFNPKHLQWGTHAENAADMVEHETQARGESHGSAKLTELDVLQIRRMLGIGARQVDMATQFGIAQCSVSEIKQRKTWRHI